MQKELFLDTTEKYGKEEFRKTLAEYITKEKPPYPLLQSLIWKRWLITFVNYKIHFTDYLKSQR